MLRLAELAFDPNTQWSEILMNAHSSGQQTKGQKNRWTVFSPLMRGAAGPGVPRRTRRGARVRVTSQTTAIIFEIVLRR